MEQFLIAAVKIESVSIIRELNVVWFISFDAWGRSTAERFNGISLLFSFC
ncbi:MAG: hypothetical protein ACTS44_01015 [Candidatus Hodgkinia cicadicola]